MQIFILGMHRSGTSLVTRLLGMMGATLGPEEALLPGDRHNPAGYFERVDVVRFHEGLLDRLGASWDNLAPLTRGGGVEALRDAFEAGARPLLAALDHHRPWALKDPRACLFFSLWKELLESPVAVVVTRDPRTIARSLARRNRLPPEQSLALWEMSMGAARAATRHLPHVHLCFEELLADPVATCRELRRALEACGVEGLEDPPAEAVIAALDRGRVEPHPPEDLEEVLLLPRHQRLWSALRGREIAEDPDADSLSPETVETLVWWERLATGQRKLEEARDAVEVNRRRANQETADRVHQVGVLLARTRDQTREAERLRLQVAAAQDHRRSLERSVGWRLFELARRLAGTGVATRVGRWLQLAGWALAGDLAAQRRRERARWALEASGLFDTAFYLRENPEVLAEGLDPLWHYIDVGVAEGRRPNPLFDPSWYLARYPEAAAAAGGPLEYYATVGEAKGHSPHPLFDTAFYLSEYPDVAAAGMSPLYHFLHHGLTERDPNPSFRTRAYLEAHPEVAAAGVPALLHFLGHDSEVPGFPEKAPRLQDEPVTPVAGALETWMPITARASSRLSRALEEIPIAFATPNWAISGVNTFTEALVRGLVRRGYDAHLLLTDARGRRDAGFLPDLPVRHLPSNWGGLARRWQALDETLRDRVPAILVPNYDYAMSAYCPALPREVGVLGIVHSDDEMHYEHVHRLGRYWNWTVGVSALIRDQVAKLVPGLGERLSYIPYGIDTSGIPDLTDRARAPVLRILYTGRLESSQKRVTDIPMIVERLEARGVPFRLTLIGTGSLEASLRQSMAGALARGRVEMPGRMQPASIQRALAASDAFLLTSNFEGLPLSLLEALANGVVPVVSDIRSGIPETVEDGVSGFVVPIGDVDAFAERLERLQRDRPLLEAMARAARRSFERGGFDASNMTDRYEEVFRRIGGELLRQEYRRPRPFCAHAPYARILLPPWMQASSEDVARLQGELARERRAAREPGIDAPPREAAEPRRPLGRRATPDERAGDSSPPPGARSRPARIQRLAEAVSALLEGDARHPTADPLPAVDALRGAVAEAGPLATQAQRLVWMDAVYSRLRGVLNRNPIWLQGPRRPRDLFHHLAHWHALHPDPGGVVIEFGCGGENPLALTVLHYLNGADRTLATDLAPALDPARAAVALFDLLVACRAAPHEFHLSGISRGEFLRRLERFDLEALRAGDGDRGLRHVPCDHVVGDFLESWRESRIGPADLIFSHSVLEHVMPLGEVARQFHQALAPDGVMIHAVDFRDHRSYSRELSPWAYLMEGGEPQTRSNELRFSRMVATLEGAGFRLLEASRIEETPPPEVEERLREEFRGLPHQDLTTQGATMTLRRQARAPRGNPRSESRGAPPAPGPSS